MPGHRAADYRSPGIRIFQIIASDSQTFGAEFTSKQPSSSRVLLPLEPDFSNMSDPSVAIELPSNNWRSDNYNNNENYRQNQTSLSGRRSKRDQSREKQRGGDRDRPLHPPLQLIHLQTLARETLEDLNIPVRREEGDIHLLPLFQYVIVRYVTMADSREIDTVHRLHRTASSTA